MKRVVLGQRVAIDADEWGVSSGRVSEILPDGRCRVDLDRVDSWLIVPISMLSSDSESR